MNVSVNRTLLVCALVLVAAALLCAGFFDGNGSSSGSRQAGWTWDDGAAVVAASWVS